MTRLIFIPDFIRSALEANRISLIDVDAMAHDHARTAELFGNLSRYDNMMYGVFARQLSQLLPSDTLNLVSKFISVSEEQERLLIAQHIILNNVPKSSDVVFHTTDGTLFVELPYEAFQSYMADPFGYVRSIEDEVFNKYLAVGGESVKNTPFFSQYIQSKLKN